MLLHINGKFTIQQLYYYPERNHKLCNIISSERYILHIQVLLECCINREIYTLYTGGAGMLYQQRDIYSIYRWCWNVVSTERYILYIQVLLECCINREIYTLYTGTAGMLYQQRDIYSIYKCCWNVVSTERYILYIQVLLECCINREIYTLYTGAAGMYYIYMESLQWNNYTTILIGTTSSVISYHQRDIYSIYRCCWNVATYKWKVYNRTIILLS